MRWFRDNIGRGSWLALIALVINLSLSFGHIHSFDGKAVSAGPIGKLLSAAAHDDGGTPAHPDDDDADTLCPICMASSDIAVGLVSSPPALVVDFAVGAIGPPAARNFARIERPRVAFQSRGPPLT
ncbi:MULTISPECIES: DUF2946 family protein [unclassified Bradyrhizobium]|uniref:DUF2946 family protein n=1 Tax=unclassified Bradyrhizobium TaxID=2631580 RepID=UPI0028EA41CA|nr:MULTISPECIES: DUF2946 family protein [unclassified Bradyrhizobium]